MLAAGALLIPTSTASAATRDGVCDPGEFCLYYNSNGQGSVSDFNGSIPNYGSRQPNCYEFKGAGNGRGKCVKNNAASVWNRTGTSVTVYYNSNHSGRSQVIPNGSLVNLQPGLKNENASHSVNYDRVCMNGVCAF
nr:peptidase inhibitor family I36 protein [Actinomyces sp. ZJ308]